MPTELIISVILLVCEVALLAFFLIQSRRPTIPGKVRVFPYGPAIIFTTVAILLTCAHIISLLTGTQLQPKRPKGMR